MPSSRPVSALSVRTFACVVAALALGGPARADCISQTVGTTTIHNCDGKLSTSHTSARPPSTTLTAHRGVADRGQDHRAQLQRQARYVPDRRLDHHPQH